MGRAGEAANSRRARKQRQSYRNALITLGLALVAASVVAVPEAMLALGTTQARRCLDTYEAPRGPERPACAGAVQRFLFPARVPWTSTRARYRAEELGARIATL